MHPSSQGGEATICQVWAWAECPVPGHFIKNFAQAWPTKLWQSWGSKKKTIIAISATCLHPLQNILVFSWIGKQEFREQVRVMNDSWSVGNLIVMISIIHQINTIISVTKYTFRETKITEGRCGEWRISRYQFASICRIQESGSYLLIYLAGKAFRYFHVIVMQQILGNSFYICLTQKGKLEW